MEGGPAWKGPGLPGEGVEVREVRWFARTRLVCDHGGVGAKPNGWTQGEPGVGKPGREPTAGQHQARRAARSQGAHGRAPDPHPTPRTPRALRWESMTSHRPQRSNVATEQVVKVFRAQRPQGRGLGDRMPRDIIIKAVPKDRLGNRQGADLENYSQDPCPEKDV